MLPGQLRGEKVGLMAQVRKQQARIQHLKQTVTDLGKQVRWASRLYAKTCPLVIMALCPDLSNSHADGWSAVWKGGNLYGLAKTTSSH